MPAETTVKRAGVKFEIGLRVRAAREAANLHISELAKAVGVTPTTFFQRENGRSHFTGEEIVLVARRLGVSADLLLGLDAPPEAENAALVRLLVDMPPAVQNCARAALRAMYEASRSAA